MARRIMQLGGKRRKIVEMLNEDESNSSFHSEESFNMSNVKVKLIEKRKPTWEAIFQKYDVNFESSSNMSLKISDEEDKQNVYNFRPKKKKHNFAEEMESDVSQDFDLDGDAKEIQETPCQESRSSLNISTSLNCSQNENYRASDTSNKNNKTACLDKKVHIEKKEPVEKDMKNQNENYRASEVSNKNNKTACLDKVHIEKKEPVEKDMKNQNENYRASDTNNRNNKTACLNKKVHIEKKKTVEKDMKNPTLLCKETKTNNSNETSKFENVKSPGNRTGKSVKKMWPKKDSPRILEWKAKFAYFLEHQWEDFRKNPGSILMPLPEVKPSRKDKKWSWEGIMNSK